MNEIKTIVWDLGGVYFTRGSYLAIERIIDIYEIDDRDLVYQTFSSKYKEEGFKIRLGLITMDEFEESFFEKIGVKEPNKKHIRNIWFGSYVPHFKIEKVVRELSEKYRLLIFSGNIKERIQFLDERYDFLQYFDEYLFSYDFQMNKNDIKFHKTLLEYIECEPSETLVIDDEKRNVNMSKQLGMNGILYYYLEQLLGEFEKYNIKVNI